MIYLFIIYVSAYGVMVNAPLATFNDMLDCKGAAVKWEKRYPKDVAVCSTVKQEVK